MRISTDTGDRGYCSIWLLRKVKVLLNGEPASHVLTADEEEGLVVQRRRGGLREVSAGVVRIEADEALRRLILDQQRGASGSNAIVASDDRQRLVSHAAQVMYAAKIDDMDFANCSFRSLPQHLQDEIESMVDAITAERRHG